MRIMFRFAVLVSISYLFSTANGKLSVCDKSLCYGGKPIYLSGVNQAWQNYANDFGNGKYADAKSELSSVLSDIGKHGGNSIRIWLHTDASNTPVFNEKGIVTSADQNKNHIVTEMKEYLDEAKKHNVIVFFTLWNLATWNPTYSKNIGGLIESDTKLESYINKALIPIVSGLKGHVALGGYDIANEPEGSISKSWNWESCFNTLPLIFAGIGWTKQSFSMQRILRFINWQADAIKRTDSTALVTVGAWGEKTQSSLTWDSRNYYSDDCLLNAGKRLKGKLDFFQIHTYAHGGKYTKNSPMKIKASKYKLDKPIVIGEFSSSGGDGRSISSLIQHAYSGGYAGTWSWHARASGKYSDSLKTQMQGLLLLKDKSDVKVVSEYGNN